jgi:hypothetical protein
MQREIASSQIHTVVSRMPKIELSYETNFHKKDESSYKIAFAIPAGKKYYAWITYDEQGDDVIYMMEINREHKIAKIHKIPRTPTEIMFELGTIFYGTILEGDLPVFIIEDVLYDRGFSTKSSFFANKMNTAILFISSTLEKLVMFALPAIWEINGNLGSYTIPDKWANEIGYPIHHIQYRCPMKIAPYMNLFSNKPSINIEGNLVTSLKTDSRELITYKCKYRHDYSKPQYRMPTIFLVKADIQTDIYRLFAYGKNKSREYYGIAYIASYESSVFMNGIFRHIKENQNLDFIEESDDEEEFENIDPERFVNLEKDILIECIFHQKFKKWVPKRIMNHGKIVHIGQLCRD